VFPVRLAVWRLFAPGWGPLAPLEQAPEDPGEHLLGFSARTSENHYIDDWPPARRDLYLLRFDLDRPLSTDTAVWPAVSVEAPLLGPPWHRSVKVWPDLPAIQRFLPRRAYEVVALTLVLRDLKGDELAEWQDIDSLDAKDPLPLGSTRLGYDVSDRALLSGLTNCGYSTDAARELRPVWGPRLNRYHLFSQLADAVVFKALTDRRVPEHAPFFCYGLYLAPSRPSHGHMRRSASNLRRGGHSRKG
jgi:hypothetical protein